MTGNIPLSEVPFKNLLRERDILKIWFCCIRSFFCQIFKVLLMTEENLSAYLG